MHKPVRLSEIVQGMDSLNDEVCAFFDRRTGQVEFVMAEDLVTGDDEFDELGELEEFDEPGDDEADDEPAEGFSQFKDMTAVARAVAADEDDRFVSLPSRYDIHEWSIMEQFVLSQEDAAVVDELQRAIHGRGAFRVFKDRLHVLNLTDQWYAYRDEQYEQIARAWCQEHGIEIAEVSPPNTPE